MTLAGPISNENNSTVRKIRIEFRETGSGHVGVALPSNCPVARIAIRKTEETS
jgi:hypothetical protein